MCEVVMNKVGAILKKARIGKYLECKDVSKATKIHPKYIKALEEGNYEMFSSAVHIKGFLKNYAKYLGVDVEQVLAFWRREYNYSEENDKRVIKNRSKPLDIPRVVLTPGLLFSSLSFILIVVFFGYLYFQYRSFAEAPELIIDSPVEKNVTTTSPNLNIVGRTDRDAVLTINGQEISLDEEGMFATTITLSEGVNTLNFVSTNKLGKSSRQTKTIVVEATNEKETSEDMSEATVEATPTTSQLQLEVQIGPDAAWMEVIVDGRRVFDGLLGPGVKQIFTARESVKIKTGNAGSTKVILNGEDQGVLGEAGEVVEREFQRS